MSNAMCGRCFGNASMTIQFKSSVYISYLRKDEREANWLHKALEWFRNRRVCHRCTAGRSQHYPVIFRCHEVAALVGAHFSLLVPRLWH